MLSELNDTINRTLDARITGDGFCLTAVPGLTLMRFSELLAPQHMQYQPKLCLVTQGAKQVMVADRVVTYGAGQSLVVTVEVPVVSQALEASRDAPFVGASLSLDPAILLDVVTRMNTPPSSQPAEAFGLMVTDLDAQIMASFQRLLEVSGQPQAVDILYPAIMREISYWLLTGPAGHNVARMVLPEGQPQRIARAIAHLRENFDVPVSVPELASASGMSPSSFHQHFKALTSMTPLQYQKNLRLLEARRLMVAHGEKAGVAAIAVGYESASQFSREYARMFGAPPRRETQRAKADHSRTAAQMEASF